MRTYIPIAAETPVNHQSPDSALHVHEECVAPERSRARRNLESH